MGRKIGEELVVRMRSWINHRIAALCSRSVLSMLASIILLGFWAPLAHADNEPATSTIRGSIRLSSTANQAPMVFAISSANHQLIQSDSGSLVASYPMSQTNSLSLLAWDTNSDGFAEPVVVGASVLEFLLHENGVIASNQTISFDLSNHFDEILASTTVDLDKDGIEELLLGGIKGTTSRLALLKSSDLGPQVVAYTDSQTRPAYLLKLVSTPSSADQAVIVSSTGHVFLLGLDSFQDLVQTELTNINYPITAAVSYNFTGSSQADLVLAGTGQLFTIVDIAGSNPQTIVQELDNPLVPTSAAAIPVAKDKEASLALTLGVIPGLSTLWILRFNDGVFELSQSFAPGGIPSGVAILDQDNDNDFDLVFSDSVNNSLYFLEQTQSESSNSTFIFRGDLSVAAGQSTTLPLALKLGGVSGVRVSFDDSVFGFSDAQGNYLIEVPYGHTNITAEKNHFSFLKQNYMALLGLHYKIDFLAALGDQPPAPPVDDSDSDDSTGVDDFAPQPIPVIPDNDDLNRFDSDLDGISDLQEMFDGSSPFDAGSYKPNLAASRYAFWNTFLNQRNIVEAANPNSESIDISINSLGTNAQSLRSPSTARLHTNAQQDFFADNGLAQNPAYGMVALDASRSSAARLMRYRFDAEGRIQSAVLSPFRPAMFGTTAVTFNTYHPDTLSSSSTIGVANWLSLASFSDSVKIFTVNMFDQSGKLVDSTDLELAPFERRDIDGGHRFGPNQIGLVEIVPHDSSSPYLAELFRHANSPQTQSDLGINIPTKKGNGEHQYFVLDQQSNAISWLETANVSNASVAIAINLFAPDGFLAQTIETTLEPKSQRHFNLSQLIDSNETMLVQVTTRSTASIVANCISYSKNDVDSTWAATVLTAREAFGHKLNSSYNTFSNSQNTLVLGNTARVAVEVTIAANGQSIQMEMPPFSSTLLELTSDIFSLEDNTYGLVSVESSLPGTIVGNILRAKKGAFAVRAPLE